MQLHELACSYKSLHAVPFFVWAAHKNFAVLVFGFPICITRGAGGSSHTLAAQGCTTGRVNLTGPCLAPSPPPSPSGWSPPPWGSSWPTCSCNTEILSLAKWMFYNYPSYQQPIIWDRSGTDTREAEMGHTEVWEHLTNNFWCINGQLWSK